MRDSLFHINDSPRSRRSNDSPPVPRYKIETKAEKLKRPTFNYQNDPTKPIRAAGILFHVKINHKCYILMSKYGNQWADLGGKTDVLDSDVMETAAREASEETNCMLVSDEIIKDVDVVKEKLTLSINFIKDLLNKESTKIIYFAACKYLLYSVELPTEFLQSKNPESFLDHEVHNQYPRIIDWITKKKINQMLHEKMIIHGRIRSILPQVLADL